MQRKIKSPLGDLYLTASDRGLTGIYFSSKFQDGAGDSLPAKAVLDQAVLELAEYFALKRRRFNIPLDLKGTAFQRKVWRALLKVPFGETVAYKDIARRIKSPKAVRAVGSANGKNPLCIVVPCHRVISSDGSIGGYSGGLSVKKKLLAYEGVLIIKESV